MAEVTLVASGANAVETANATSHTVSIPALNTNDSVIISLSLASSSAVSVAGLDLPATAPSITSRSGHAQHVWTKNALASTAAPTTLTFTTASTLKVAIQFSVLRGVSTAADAISVSAGVSGATATSFSAPAITPTANQVVIQAVGNSSGSAAPPTVWTPPSGMTLQVTRGTGGTTGRSSGAIATSLTKGAAVGTAWTTDTSATWSAVTIGVMAAVDAPPPSTQPRASILLNMGNFNAVDPVVADELYTGAAFAVSSTKTLGGTVISPNDSRFRLRGGGNWAFGTGTPDSSFLQPASRYPNTWGYPRAFGVDFIFTGQRFEVYFKHVANSALIRVLVNGKRVTKLMQATGAATGGNTYYYKVDLGQVVTGALITLELNGMPFGGIVPETGASISNGILPFTERVIVQGDSVSDGSAENTGANSGTWVLRTAKYLSWQDTWNQAIGGTGFVEPGTAVNFVDRTTDVTAWSPTRIIVWGGGNDGNTSIVSAATTLVTNYQTANPGVPIYLIGTWAPTFPASTARANRDLDLEQVARAKRCYFISPITGRIRDHRGYLVATKTPMISSSSEAAAYVGADGTHPNDAGHDHIALWLKDAFTTLGEAAATITLWNGTIEVTATLEITADSTTPLGYGVGAYGSGAYGDPA